MRLVAVTRILDETDIVESFVRHTASLVDHPIFLDNGSQDGTLDILTSLSKEGLPISVMQNKCVSFNEGSHLTFLFREAATKHGADWVACLDADEFLDDRLTDGGLISMLWQTVDTQPDAVAIELPMAEYIATREDLVCEMIVPVRIRKRRELSGNRKVIVRVRPETREIEIQHGGHGVKHGWPPGKVVYQDGLRLAHYSERSPFQYITKFVRGWSRVLAAGTELAASGHAYHYKSPYESLRDHPEQILRNDWFMGFKNESPLLSVDPIRYSGGTLRYTAPNDEAMRAVRSLMTLLHDLALRHGEILDAFPEVRAQVANWDAQCRVIIQ